MIHYLIISAVVIGFFILLTNFVYRVMHLRMGGIYFWILVLVLMSIFPFPLVIAPFMVLLFIRYKIQDHLVRERHTIIYKQAIDRHLQAKEIKDHFQWIPEDCPFKDVEECIMDDYLLDIMHLGDVIKEADFKYDEIKDGYKIKRLNKSFFTGEFK